VEQQKITLSIGVNDHRLCILSTLKYITVEIWTILCSRCVSLGLILDFKVTALHFKDFFRPYLYSSLITHSDAAMYFYSLNTDQSLLFSDVF